MNADLYRIQQALEAAREVLAEFTPGRIASRKKLGGDPVTEADVLLDRTLKDVLLRNGEGWLSEETVDDQSRLMKERVWIVDPLDGTREFIEGIPEWCISIALAENGKPIAAGICSPATGQIFLGSDEDGATLNGKSIQVSDKKDLDGAKILASRSEVRRGEWRRFAEAPFEVIPMGSVAYKLACVSAGLADGTFTLVPKNEWDVAAGVLLVEAAGGQVVEKSNRKRLFNQPNTLLDGLFAGSPELLPKLIEQIRLH